MLVEDLVKIVRNIENEKCEGQYIEIKSAKGGCPKLYDTLSSFSNQNGGGVIIFGINETTGFELVGVYDAQDLIHKASDQCKQMEPEVRAIFTSCKIDNKSFVSMEIPPAENIQRPVYYKGAGKIRGSYIRVGDADEIMSEFEIYSYEAFRKQIKDDIRVADVEDMSCIDKHQLDNFLNILQMNKPNASSLSKDELLKLMGLIKEDKPTLTSVLCFSKYPQAIYPQLCITAVLIPGLEIGENAFENERFLDNKKIEGTISQMVDSAVNFVSMNMKHSVSIKNGKRTDVLEYPLTAVREAILNALVHRDYSVYSEGVPVRIEMYKNRMEIINVGELYGALDIDKLGRVHSDTRNKTLISVLETLGVVENRFSGIPTIIRQMKEANLPAPEFISKKGMFKVILYNNKVNNNDSNNKNVLEFCREPKSREEIASYLNMTQYYAIKNYIEPLLNENLIAYTIPDKPKSKSQKFYTRKN